MLGPARFDHIRTVTTQALDLLSAALVLPTLLKRLKELDDEIESLLEPSTGSSTEKGKGKGPEGTDKYDGMTVATVERLVKAREMRVQFLKKKMDKEREWNESMEAIEMTERAEGSGNGIGKKRKAEREGVEEVALLKKVADANNHAGEGTPGEPQS